MPERLTFTTAETASLLGISQSGVYGMIRQGVIRSVNIGGSRRLVPRAEFERLGREASGDPTWTAERAFGGEQTQ
ncbi:helix-turn-helix domain-containing protein [Roseomonas sp. PWR1]|uniref:Helix-turn-helix domain-containing protein n=1 Tax=Roseomonas nitratireducens TaxID=2820810 RepID=A0ABS4AX86_9PROT|nr:helix-turn-helix domain-containing protein [Neoroseomonas nitratireducens]